MYRSNVSWTACIYTNGEKIKLLSSCIIVLVLLAILLWLTHGFFLWFELLGCLCLGHWYFSSSRGERTCSSSKIDGKTTLHIVVKFQLLTPLFSVLKEEFDGCNVWSKRSRELCTLCKVGKHLACVLDKEAADEILADFLKLIIHTPSVQCSGWDFVLF